MGRINVANAQVGTVSFTPLGDFNGHSNVIHVAGEITQVRK